VLDRDNSLVTTGTDLNSPIVRRKIEAPYQLSESHALVSQWLKTAKTSKVKDGYLDYAGKRVLNVNKPDVVRRSSSRAYRLELPKTIGPQSTSARLYTVFVDSLRGFVAIIW
jgi:hypothetical protein